MTTESAFDITLGQIEDLRLDRSKPLVICDVDEVVVHFIAGLERYLHRNELWLDPASFGLNGNVKYNGTDVAVAADDLQGHFAAFFNDEIHQLDPIEGAASALSDLSEHANVLMLTNLPDKYRDARMKNLAEHNMPYPVVTNQGPKGPAVHALKTRYDSPAVFIDDIPNYLNSVSESCPDVHLIHFMQDDRFGRHLPELDYVSLRTDNWPATHSHIRSLLTL
ncbi:MAG: hypothetical protein ACR2OM_01895 [Aestuariivirgaceae bacterium]